MVQGAVEQYAGALHRHIGADQGCVGVLNHRGGVGGLDPEGAVADIDNGAFAISGGARVGGGCEVVQAHITGGRDVQVAVFEQDRCVDVHGAAVVAFGLVQSSAGGLAVVVSDRANVAAGNQRERLAAAHHRRNDRCVDVDPVTGFDAYIVVGQAVGDDAVTDVVTGRIDNDIDLVRVQQPQTRSRAAGGVHGGVASDTQALARGFHYATLDTPFGAGLAGKLGVASGPDHHLAAFFAAIGRELGALLNLGLPRCLLGAFALEAAADQRRTAFASTAGNIDLSTTCQFDLIAQYTDLTAVTAFGRQLAADLSLLSIAQHNSAALIAD
ncbi:hypothetical protein D3C78_502160 [compost metagenome]